MKRLSEVYIQYGFSDKLQQKPSMSETSPTRCFSGSVGRRGFGIVIGCLILRGFVGAGIGFWGLGEGKPKVENHPDKNRTIGDVECGPPVNLQVYIDEIRYISMDHAIRQVADDPANEHTECQLHAGGVQQQHPSAQEYDRHRDHRDDSENHSESLQHAPCCAGVPNVHQIQVSGDDGYRVEIGVEWD